MPSNKKFIRTANEKNGIVIPKIISLKGIIISKEAKKKPRTVTIFLTHNIEKVRLIALDLKYGPPREYKFYI